MRRRSSGWIVLLAALAGCDLPGKPRPGTRPVPAELALDFATLYGRNCAGCHGARGRLGPAPPLNDALFLKIVDDAELHRVIAGGRPGTPMPAFARSSGGPLSDAQVQVLAAGIKPQWSKPGEPASPEPPPYASTAAAAHGDTKPGKAAFARACAGCHGAEGEGDDAGAINDPAFLALVSNQLLRRYMITGRPDLGMPDFAGSDGRDDAFRPLSSSEIDGLVALLSRWREAGSREKSTAPRTPAP